MMRQTATKKPTEKVEVVEIKPLAEASVDFIVLGTSPFIFNKVSNDAQRELLFPSVKLKDSEKAVRLKHNPLIEFQQSVYSFGAETDTPTFLGIPARMFKAAIVSAALRLPGSTKAEMGQLTFVEGDLLPLWGLPEMGMAVVTQAGKQGAPDIRTRAYVRHWATFVTVRYFSSLIKLQSVINLMGAAGLMCGVGDWRSQKGKADFGQFRLIGAKSKEMGVHKKLQATAGRAAQLTALADPAMYDAHTDEMYQWFRAAAKERGFDEVA